MADRYLDGTTTTRNYAATAMDCQPWESMPSDFPSQPLVSVIIPARDEAKSIGSLIANIKESLFGYAHEIIVVDDGSRDATGEISRSNGTVVISHERNLGKGAAMRTGVDNASGKVIVFIDGDGAHEPQDLPGLITPILEGKAELVIGSRALPGSAISISPLTRRLSNNLASFVISSIVSFLLPLATLFRCPVKHIKITDCTSGFRAIRKEGWHKLDLMSQVFEIETEMIYEAASKRLAIAEVPISCNWNNESSRLSILRDGFSTLRLLSKKLLNEPRNLKRG